MEARHGTHPQAQGRGRGAQLSPPTAQGPVATVHLQFRDSPLPLLGNLVTELEATPYGLGADRE